MIDWEDVDSSNDVVVELFVVLLAEDLMVVVGAGHNRGGLESYAERIPLSTE